MKALLLVLSLVFAVNANALNCGETSTNTSITEEQRDVETKTPKHLEGQILVRAIPDGMGGAQIIEVVSTEDYMLVKRKHKRPVVKETTKEQSLACSKENLNKNILSAKVVDGYSDVKKSESAKEAEIRLERQVGVGVQYQRAITDRLYLGGEVDSNKGVGVLLGIGF